MFGTIGGPELILILVIALIVFGPRKLPEIGKSVGKMMAEFRRASNDFKRTIEDEVEAENRQARLPPPPAPVAETVTPAAEAVPYGAAAPAEAPAPPAPPEPPAPPAPPEPPSVAGAQPELASDETPRS